MILVSKGRIASLKEKLFGSFIALVAQIVNRYVNSVVVVVIPRHQENRVIIECRLEYISLMILVKRRLTLGYLQLFLICFGASRVCSCYLLCLCLLCSFTTKLYIGTWSNNCLVNVTVTFLTVLLMIVIDEPWVKPLSICALRAYIFFSIVIWSFSISALVIE